MRVNPKYANTCCIQIGECRADPCYDCSRLSECDQHYDEQTGEWDYPNPLELPAVKPMRKAGRYSTSSKKGAQSISQIADRKRRSLIARGLASRIPIRTNLEQALSAAGLP
ncbi:MAG: hypothetical protein WCX22_08445 [Methanoregula sp.]